MSYFLTNQNLSANQIIELSGEEARHILLARRMKKGEMFNLQGKDENRYLVDIIDINRYSLKVKTISELKTPPEPEIKITLFQSVVNEKALDFIFQKSTELGAHCITLFNSQNTATKLTSEIFKKKFERWNKILWEAAKQSDRVHPPLLEYKNNIDDVLKALGNFDKIFLCDIGGDSLKSEILLARRSFSEGGNHKSKIAIIIGPEGGFITEEIKKFKSLPSCQAITLGPILLRAETAALSSLSIISNILN